LTDPSADVESIAMPRWGKKSAKPAPPPQDYVLIKITSAEGKYATLSGKGDLLVAPKAQAAEFPATEAPRRQKELERCGFKTKIEPV
jgi:hypothetical protein